MSFFKKDIFKELDNLSKEMKEKSLDVAQKMAELFLNRLKSNIRTNKYGFNLKDTTLAIRKRRKIKSILPLIETGEYLWAIRRFGSRITVVDGIHEGTRTGKRLSYEELAWLLEYGRPEIGFNGFPVWRMTHEEIQTEIKGMMNQFANQNLPKRK